jgi:IS5 family transposase
MAQVHLNLAFRWYIGYDLEEAVPHHSTLTKIRNRFGREGFQRCFEQIVERCVEAGLVWGEELHFGGTLV